MASNCPTPTNSAWDNMWITNAVLITRESPDRLENHAILIASVRIRQISAKAREIAPKFREGDQKEVAKIL